MRMEFLFLGNQGDIAEDAITSLLIQRGQDSVIVRFRVAEPLACQHFLNTMNESNQISTRPLTMQAAPVLRPSFGTNLRNAPGHFCRGNCAFPHFLSLHLLLLSISLILSFPHPLSY